MADRSKRLHSRSRSPSASLLSMTIPPAASLTLEGGRRGACNAHHLRRHQALIAIGKEDTGTGAGTASSGRDPVVAKSARPGSLSGMSPPREARSHSNSRPPEVVPQCRGPTPSSAGLSAAVHAPQHLGGIAVWSGAAWFPVTTAIQRLDRSAHTNREGPRPAPCEPGFVRGAGAGTEEPCFPEERGRCLPWIVALAHTNQWSQRQWLGFFASRS